MTYFSFIFALPWLLGMPYAAVEHTPSTTLATVSAAASEQTDSSTHSLPFYSQFTDISAQEWQKVGCGIASLAMVIEYHHPNALTSVDALLEEGIEKQAYSDAGWTYAGLIQVAHSYDMTGHSYDLGTLSRSQALERFTHAVKQGPVIASVHYTLDPSNPIPHLIVVYRIEEGIVYYNDPAEPSGNSTISEDAFAKAWKQRYIELYPDRRVAAR